MKRVKLEAKKSIKLDKKIFYLLKFGILIVKNKL